MTYNLVTPYGNRPHAPILRGVRIGAASRGRVLRINIGEPLVAGLGWRKGSRIAVHIGSGADFGRIRLSPGTKATGFSLGRSGGCRQFTLTVRSPAIVGGDLTSTDCLYEINDDGESLTVELPAFIVESLRAAA